MQREDLASITPKRRQAQGWRHGDLREVSTRRVSSPEPRGEDDTRHSLPSFAVRGVIIAPTWRDSRRALSLMPLLASRVRGSGSGYRGAVPTSRTSWGGGSQPIRVLHPRAQSMRCMGFGVPIYQGHISFHHLSITELTFRHSTPAVATMTSPVQFT